MAKLRYEIDPHNKLVVRETGMKADISKFRHIVEGRFKIGKGNTLLYHIKAPSKDVVSEYKLPHQLKLEGKWSLTENHDLKLTLNKWRREGIGDELTLKGEIIKTEANSLLFAITQRTKENVASTYILRLEGTWQADKNNRLTFRIKREKESFDTLVFDGIWDVNKKHQLVYHYEKRLLRDKKKKHSLLLHGFWNITKRGVLTYQLDVKGKSTFDFRVGLGKAEKGRIEYELGIGLSNRERPFRKVVILYGKWKVIKGVGLIFEIKYDKNRSGMMKFGGEAKLIGNSRIKFTLENESGKDFGMTLTLSKTMLKGSGESFLRLLCSRKEKAIYVGTGFMW